MAAIKLFSEFKSDSGALYKIQIWDEDYSGSSPDEFKVSSSGFELNYSGETDNIYSPIIGSSVSFGMYIKDAATRSFISNLKDYQQDRYFVKIKVISEDTRNRIVQDYSTRVKSDGGTIESISCLETAIDNLGGTEELFWAGYITQDIIEIEDAPEPYILNIQATDGIAKLKNTLCGFSFFRKFTNQFINALDEVGVFEMYDADDSVMVVVSNWWAEEMTYNANNNPLDETFLDFHAFDTIDEEGFYTNRNWHDILSEICTLFGLRFYYSNGQYRLEQLFERKGSFTEHTYKKDRTKIGETSGLSYGKTIDQTTNKARLAGNIFNFLPAVNDVSITLDKEPKAMTGVIWDNSNDPELELGLVSSALNNQITLTFNHTIRLVLNTNVNQNPIFAKLRLNVSLFDFNNNVMYYLKRTFTGTTPSTPEWTTTQSGSGYEILIGQFEEFSAQVTLGNTPDVQQIVGPTTITTPIIPVDGDMTIDWDNVGFVESNGSVRGLSVLNSSTYKMKLSSVTTSFGSIQNQTTRIRAVSPNAQINGSVSYDLGTSVIFTGQGERGSLVDRIEVGGLILKVPYGGWRRGNSGSYQDIQRLVCEEFLKLMNTPVNKYQGRIFSDHDFRQRLTFDGRKWIQLGGTFNANLDEWSGEWFVIERATITPTFDDVNIDTGLNDFSNVNGNTGNVSFDGIESTDVNTNTLGVTENTTIGGKLGVTGLSTLNETSVGNFTTTGSVSVAINDVDASSGGSENQSLANHTNFINYSGDENGTYTINLPSAVDGALLRFKTDSSISANKKAQLTPQTGETIDGSTEPYVMDRSFDGITLMGHTFGGSTNWFVIQKKEK
jgi:hypothetical protein